MKYCTVHCTLYSTVNISVGNKLLYFRLWGTRWPTCGRLSTSSKFSVDNDDTKTNNILIKRSTFLTTILIVLVVLHSIYSGITYVVQCTLYGWQYTVVCIPYTVPLFQALIIAPGHFRHVALTRKRANTFKKWERVTKSSENCWWM